MFRPMTLWALVAAGVILATGQSTQALINPNFTPVRPMVGFL